VREREREREREIEYDSSRHYELKIEKEIQEEKK